MFSDHASGSTISNVSQCNAIVIEDVLDVTPLLQQCYSCIRLTHNELMSLYHDSHLSFILSGSCHLLWVATPADWYVRATCNHRYGHWMRLLAWVRRSNELNITAKAADSLGPECTRAILASFGPLRAGCAQDSRAVTVASSVRS